MVRGVACARSIYTCVRVQQLTIYAVYGMDVYRLGDAYGACGEGEDM